MSAITFGGNEQKPLSPGLFDIYVQSRLRSTPGVEILKHEELEFLLRVEGREMVAYLSRMYERYRSAPERLVDLVSDWLDALVHMPESASVSSFADVAAHLFPMLQQRAFVEQAAQTRARELIHRPFAAGLVITYVVDAAKTVEYVNLHELEGWGVHPDDLHSRAVENLRASVHRIQYRQHGEGASQLLMDANPDGYAATRALVADYVDEWATRLGGELLLGLPSRDLMIGFRADHPRREGLVEQLGQDERRREHPLTGRIFVWRDGELAEYSESNEG